MNVSAAFLALMTLCASSLQAQTTHVVSGIVYDSIAHAPLAGAVVQATLVDSSRKDADGAAPRTFVAIADRTGHYRLTGLSAGRFAIGFQHDALNALGLESPLDGFELSADSSITMDLAIPSGAVVRARLCANATDGAHDGMLAGFVFDARREGTLRGASVVVQWTELGLEGGKLRSAPIRVTAIVGEDGTYRACALPSEGPVTIKVTKSGYRGIDGDVAMPAGGVARRDFRLADSGGVHGTGTLVGHVVQDDGSALLSGLVSIPALSLDVAVQRGEFSMTELPAGTWIVETRAIGYEPQTTLADVAERTTSTVRIALAKKAQTLEAVNVVGKAGRDLRVLDEIQQRRLVANGTVFLQGNSWLPSALVPRGLETLNNAVLVGQVLAIEAYPDVTSAPFLWRTNDACAVIAVWTKH